MKKFRKFLFFFEKKLKNLNKFENKLKMFEIFFENLRFCWKRAGTVFEQTRTCWKRVGTCWKRVGNVLETYWKRVGNVFMVDFLHFAHCENV